MASLEHIRLENGALLDCPVFPVGVYGASVLYRDGSWAVAVQSPRIPKQSSIGMNETRRGSLVIRPVIVEVPTESGHLKSCNRNRAKLFWPTYPVCPLRANPDGNPVPFVPGDDKTKVRHLSNWGEVGVPPQLPQSDPTVAGRSVCAEGAVSPTGQMFHFLFNLATITSLPFLSLIRSWWDPLPTLIVTAFEQVTPLVPHGTELSRFLVKLLVKVLSYLTMTAKVSVRLIFPRASTYSQLPWKSNIFWSKLLVGEKQVKTRRG